MMEFLKLYLDAITRSPDRTDLLNLITKTRGTLGTNFRDTITHLTENEIIFLDGKINELPVLRLVKNKKPGAY